MLFWSIQQLCCTAYVVVAANIPEKNLWISCILQFVANWWQCGKRHIFSQVTDYNAQNWKNVVGWAAEFQLSKQDGPYPLFQRFTVSLWGAVSKKKTVAQRLGADLAWIFAISNSSYKQFHCGDTWQLGSFTTSLALRILVLCRVRGSYGKVTSLGHNDVVLLEWITTDVWEQQLPGCNKAKW